jgi:hypothetical protein
MSELAMVLHYLTCDGVGEPSQPAESDSGE